MNLDLWTDDEGNRMVVRRGDTELRKLPPEQLEHWRRKRDEDKITVEPFGDDD